MPIKYGEIFIKHNTNNLWANAVFWFGYDEQPVSEDSTIIVKFDDDDIQEVSNKSTNVNFEFNNDTYYIPTIVTIKRKCRDIDIYINDKYFRIEPKINNDGKRKLVFRNIFKNYEHYNSNNTVASYFNCIYSKVKVIESEKVVESERKAAVFTVKEVEVFSVVRIKSSISSPRYQIAYDSNEFSKDELLVLINYIFRQPSQP
jgi:hypothetical protein